MGYFLAGFDVVGVDIDPQPNYPFEFHQADAMTFSLRGFDAVAASPPCQRYSVTAAMTKRGHEHPDLVAPMRKKLRASGLPYVMENVPGAPLIDPLKLDGEMFGLPLIRMRWFESNVPLVAPRTVRRPFGRGYASVFGGKGGRGPQNTKAQWCKAMGIDWMTMPELAQAIPPAYTHWIGMQLAARVTDQLVQVAA